MSRPKNTQAGRQIALPRPVAALAHQLARAEERAVQTVIERALRAYALASPEWQAQASTKAPHELPVQQLANWRARQLYAELPPQRDGDAQQQDGADQHPEHGIPHREA